MAALEHPQSGADPLLDEFLPQMQAYDIPADAVLHLLEGLISDQSEVALENADQLILYSYQVAGTVGRMMCPVLGCIDKTAVRHAIDMGIGMQLTNIARDVREDAEMGRRYLPATWVDGLPAHTIASIAHHPQTAEYQLIQRAIAQLLKLADQYYASGEQGLASLPLRARCAIAVAGRVYREIGIQLRDKDYRWSEGRVVTTKWQKIAVSIPALARHIYARTPRHTHASHLHRPLLNLLPPQ